MKKLLLAICIIFTFDVQAEEICSAAWTKENMIGIIVAISQTEETEIEFDKLLSVCNEGDILKMTVDSYYEVPNRGYDAANERALSKTIMARTVAKYCDLKETHIIGNNHLVCRLVKREGFFNDNLFQLLYKYYPD